MLPTIVKSTRVTESTATLIGNIFINPSNLVDNIRTGIIYSDITDHFQDNILLTEGQTRNMVSSILNIQLQKCGMTSLLV